MEIARARFASKPPMNTWSPAVLSAYVNHGLVQKPDGQVTLKCPKQVEAWLYEVGGASDLFEHLPELQSEILLLSGSLSDVRPLVLLQHPRLSRGTLEIVEGAGHFLPQEHPEITAMHLKAWLGGVSARQ
jgi:pimeloyl-ACP methyl ester carboxylesterase